MTTQMADKRTYSSPPRRVALFVTCMVDMIYPEVGTAAVELLERHGVEVLFPLEQTCCGQPAFNAGFWEEARPLARRFVDIFEPLLRSKQIDAVVAPSGSCTAMTSHFYRQLLAEEPGYLERAALLAAATFELTEFLVDVLGVEAVDAQFTGRLTYHGCCHLLRELGIDRQPRTLLQQVNGAEWVELNGADECCGFGGLFAVKNSGISTAMGNRKVQNLVRSDADVVALCDVSCMTHINGLLSRQGERCRAVHIAQVLANQVDVSPRSLPEPPPQPLEKPRRWQDTT